MMSRAAVAAGASIALGLAISLRAVTPSGPDSPVAPLRLADTGLYKAGQPGVIDERNRRFSPQYPLWTDGATKRRWVYLPPGTTIDATGVDWEMPVGTRFWKEFSFGGRKVETRFLWRASADRWVFASYVWNADGTNAVIASRDGVEGAADLGNGREHAIPSVSDCRTCHVAARVTPLGFNALQLSTDRDPNAIHGEPLAADMVTVKTLIEQGRLRGTGVDLIANPPRIRTTSAATRSVLGYFTANCGTCHNNDSGIALLGGSLKSSDVVDGDATAAAMVARRTLWQRPGAGDGDTRLLDPAQPEASALLIRMHSRRPSSQMPPLGTVARDEEAIARIRAWMSALPRQ